MNALARSASPKGLKDCRKQQKCMIAELFLCRRRTKSTLPTLRRYAYHCERLQSRNQCRRFTTSCKLLATHLRTRTSNWIFYKLNFFVQLLLNLWKFGTLYKIIFTKLWRSHSIWSTVLLVHSLCNFISIRHTVHQIWMQEEEWQPFGAS